MIDTLIPEICAPTLRERCARMWFWIYRFRSLPRAGRLFGNSGSRRILARRLFRYRFLCDVSRPGPSRQIYLEGERFISERKLIASLLRPGFRSVDVGANLGYYCLMILQRVGSKGRVIAIEPSPENLPWLLSNLESNDLLGQVDIIECAVGDETRTVGLRAGINSGVSNGNRDYLVRMDTLDNLVKGPIDFLKMDIEGYEYFALKGATAVLRRYHPILFVEIHPQQLRELGLSVKSVISLLGDLYSRIEFYEQGHGFGAITKLLRLYFGIREVRKVNNITEFIGHADREFNIAPFWAICRHP